MHYIRNDTFLERAHSYPVLSPLQLAVHLVQITVGVVPQDLQPAIKLPNCIEQMNIIPQHITIIIVLHMQRSIVIVVGIVIASA